jgi:hypothetical protein
MAGTLAALWAMTGLANDYAALSAVGALPAVIVAAIANVALVVGASLAFVGARSWRPLLMATLLVVTIDRIAGAESLGPGFAPIVGAIVAFVAISAATVIGIRTT